MLGFNSSLPQLVWDLKALLLLLLLKDRCINHKAVPSCSTAYSVRDCTQMMVFAVFCLAFLSYMFNVTESHSQH